MKLGYRQATFAILLFSMSSLANAGLIYSSNFDAENEEPIITSVSYYYYSSINYASQTYSETGLEYIDGLSLEMNLDLNLFSGTLGFQFSLNDSIVGTWDLTGSSIEQKYNLDFNFAELNSTSTDWTLRMDVYDPICTSCGAIRLTELNDVTFKSSHVNSVPEPTTLAIFALGMIGLASRRFKKLS
ncbi:PEP-CTERM sorting domain-containing protein [Colwellia sp. 20A7]|uniref:PEP-CTERM sorting domain-containing protein n=1 Tax=Colwellia sp. 20A7 TaxID=2689569 RepID=UPI001F3E424F|nr:PEP-CTERM sorting domain-containing protein [Colwellia sp. 20A7]